MGTSVCQQQLSTKFVKTSDSIPARMGYKVKLQVLKVLLYNNSTCADSGDYAAKLQTEINHGYISPYSKQIINQPP